MYYNSQDIHNCSHIAAGTVICLPLACDKLWSVRDGETCLSIAVENGLSTENIIDFNAQINWNCTNLHSTNPTWGSTLCVSTPGGAYSGRPASNETSNSGNAGPAGCSGYGYELTDPPANAAVATGTMLACGGWYTNSGRLSCVQICLANSIRINLLTRANPSLGKATCDQDLVLNEAYCVAPLADFNNTASAAPLTTETLPSGFPVTPMPAWGASSSTTTSTTTSIASTPTDTLPPAMPNSEGFPVRPMPTVGAAPGPTQAGVTASCKTWRKIVSGDGCWAISQEYNIELPNFYKWNPGVGNDCSSLWLDYYVCVGA